MHGRIPRAIWGIWISICIVLLILTVLEVAATAVSAVTQRRPSRSDQEDERQLRVGVSADGEWITQYVRELAEVSTEWHPYVYWRMRPYRGKYINIDKTGIRHTWNGTPSSSQLKIFVLGGSALWGIGARDEYTIPSLVSKRLVKQMATAVRVTNFGQVGYVNTQEVIALMLELQRGNVPDIVAFYDGANDMFSAFQNGIAGIPLNESNRVAEFNLIRSGDLRPILLKRLALYRAIERAFRPDGGSRVESLPGDNAALGEALAKAVVDAYVGNIELVQSLSRRYGFKAFFFWQPLAPAKRNPSPQERQELALRRNTRSAPFFWQVRKALNERMSPGMFANFHDLSDVFGNEDRTVFKDSIHLLETGNDRVAEAMVQVLRSAVSR